MVQVSGYGDLQTPGQLQRQLFGPVAGDRFVHGLKHGRRSSALAVLVLCRMGLRGSARAETAYRRDEEGPDQGGTQHYGTGAEGGLLTVQVWGCRDLQQTNIGTAAGTAARTAEGTSA